MRPSAAICYELGGTYSLQRSLWSFSETNTPKNPTSLNYYSNNSHVLDGALKMRTTHFCFAVKPKTLNQGTNGFALTLFQSFLL